LYFCRADINYRICLRVGFNYLVRFAAGPDRSTSERVKISNARGEVSHAQQLIPLQVNRRVVLVSGFSFRESAAAIVGRVRHGHPLRDKLSGYNEHDTGFEMHQAMREEGFEIRIVVW